MLQLLRETGEIYQGQFGEFTIDRDDRLGVLIYRSSLAIAALCFGLATLLVVTGQGEDWGWGTIAGLYALFCGALGISLLTIHIYLKTLHLTLQLFWAVGTLASLAIALRSSLPLPLTVYQFPLTLLGIGFVFAALTGIYFKEAFCFNRLETKLLTPLVPLLLLGHLFGWLPLSLEQPLLALWAALFAIFALRKTWQPIPADIGDKSVFAYLQQRRTEQSNILP